MLRLILRRLLLTLPTLLGMSVLAFALVAAAPGDPVRNEALRQGIVLTPANEAALREEMGLVGSLPERYLRWLGRALQGDFGLSTANRRSVAQEISSHAGATLKLAGAALLLAMVVALPAGLAAALTRHRIADWLWRAFSVLLVSTPSYWLALIALYVFALQLGWARVVSEGGANELWLPAGVLALGIAAPASRLIRERALQVLSEDHIRLAIVQGLAPWRIVLWRLLPNTLLPLIPWWAHALGAMLGGAVIIEAVFGWPGLGRLVLQAIAERDHAVLQAYLCLMGLVFVSTSLAADLLTAWLDPRVRRSAMAV